MLAVAAATGLAVSASGQIQVAGNLLVDVDATGAPIGNLTYLPNNGTLGGVFVAYSVNSNATTRITPQIAALAGNGSRGVLLDGNNISLRHFSDPTATTAVLPPASLVGATPIFSVEAWAYKSTIMAETALVAWGTRTTGQNVSCNWGRNVTYGGFSWQGGGYDYAWNVVPPAGSWHHLVWTYDGAGNLMLYRDGVLDSTYYHAAALNVNAAYNIVLGVQHNNSQTAFAQYAHGILAKARVHDGVLTPAQIANNYAVEVSSFNLGGPVQDLVSGPTHRYSFNQAPTNNAVGLTVPDTGSAPGASAVIRGTGANASFDGNQLNLVGGASATASYVDLPNGLVSPLSAANGGPGQVTFEMWVTPAAQNWGRLMDFGSNTVGEVTAPGGSFNGQNYILVAGQVNTDLEHSRVEVYTTSGSSLTVGSRMVPEGIRGAPAQAHYVVTWDEASDLITIYVNGLKAGTYNVAYKMSVLKDINNWLGRSNWSGDANFGGGYREFRIYNRLLNEAEVRRNFLYGPADTASNTLVWSGSANNNWDSVSANWLADATPATFADGSGVRLDDTATGSTTLNLTGTLSPASVAVANLTKNYTLGGAGKISGPATLTKQGEGTLTLSATANDYTGQTLLLAGRTVVSSLANAGSPSPLGAATADPTNLVVNATLSYQGPSTTFDRGMTVGGPVSTLEVLNTLTLTGPVRGGANSGFYKSGPGTVVFGNGTSNLLAGGAGPGFNVVQGTVVFDGNPSGGIQTNRISGETWVGGTKDYPGHLVISNATLLADTWLGIGRGNGSIGNASTLRLENGRVIIAANGLAMGYQPGYGTNFVSPALTLNGNSSLYAPGNVNVGESAGSSASIFLNGSSWLRGSTIRLGITAGLSGNGSSGNIVIANSAAITNANYTSVGTAAATATAPVGGAGTLVIKDNGGFYSASDFNVSDVGGTSGGSSGQVDLMNNGTLTVGNLYVGKGQGCMGVLNQSGGNLIAFGTFANVGSAGGSSGTMTVSGGNFGFTNAAANLVVGSAGIGTLTVSGTGLVTAPNALILGNAGGASGTVNLDGGTITTKRVYMGNAGASSFLAFNGGILKAADGANVDFLSGLGSAYVSAGGAKIDSGNNDITIAQDLFDSGGGGLTKLGAGTLKLPGYLYYTGPTLVNAGKLAISTRATGTANVTVADGAEFSVQVQDFPGAAVNPANLTAGTTTGAAITVDLGGFGNPLNAPLNVSAGTLTANGTITVNLDPNSYVSSAGEIPLVSYGALAGSGTFVLGTLPPGVFGYLTNDTAASPKFIGVVVTSIKLPRWEGLAGGTWDIQVTTNWVDSVTLLPDYFYQGSRAVFDDQALGATSVALNTTVTPGGVVVTNSTLSYTISGTGRISGNSGLTKLGTGTMTLSTTNNNYTGATVIDEGGTLATTVTNNLGANSPLRIGTGTLSLGANHQRFSSTYVTNGNISGTGAIVTSASHNLAGGSIGAILAGGSLTTFGTNGTPASVFGLNTYTGRTVLAGNPLVVTNLANGGAASGVGAASANPTNLVFDGGTLTYAGAPATSDRGYTVASGGTLATVGNLALTGVVAPLAGTFIKSGPAALTYTRPGTNSLSAAAYYVGQGTVVLDGGASTPTNYLQTNRIAGDLWVGYDQVNAGALILTNSSLNVGGWLALDRGNGTIGSSSWVTLYDSLLTCGDYSSGYANAIAGNFSFSLVRLLGNSALISNARSWIGESAGADATMIIAGTSRYTQNTEWFAIGNSGRGTLTLSNSARATFPGDFNLGDVAGGDGTLNVYDNATNLALTMFVGKGNDSGPAIGVVNQFGGYVGKSATGGGDWKIGGNASTTTAGSVGTYNLHGGVFEPVNNFQIGSWGTGYWNQDGGTANCGSWPAVGRYLGSVGIMTVSGGVFNQTATGNRLIVAEEGTGTLTITNTGLVTSAGGLSIGHQATGVGVVNLDGGTLRTTVILQPGVGASSTFNFNGGVLQAAANNPTFMTGLTEAKVFDRGVRVDTAGYTITIGQPLLDGGTGGGLTKLGAGTLALSGVSTYTGATVVSNGTVLVNGTIPGAATVKSGATLGGTGTIGGVVTVEVGGNLGAGAGIGTLTLTSAPVLNGNVVAELDRNGGSSLADRIVCSAPLACSGKLVLSNLGLPLQAGDTFTVFNAPSYSGGFTLVSQTPSQSVVWNTSNLTVNGTVSVISATDLPAPTLTNSFNGSTLTFNWSIDYLGYVLQTQTNSLNTGIATNWVDIPGTGSGTSATINVDAANPTVFFRLRKP